MKGSQVLVFLLTLVFLIAVTSDFVYSQCDEEWICEDWSECYDGLQTRDCIDLNECGTEFLKPETFQDCTPQDQPPEQEECPFECCVGESAFFDKTCAPESDCIDHLCVVRESGGDGSSGIEIFKWVIIGGISAVALALVYFVFFKVLRKKPKVMAPTRSLDATLENLSKEIDSLKRFHDTSKLEDELNLAKNASKGGLKDLARAHIENIEKLKKELH